MTSCNYTTHHSEIIKLSNVRRIVVYCKVRPFPLQPLQTVLPRHHHRVRRRGLAVLLYLLTRLHYCSITGSYTPLLCSCACVYACMSVCVTVLFACIAVLLPSTFPCLSADQIYSSLISSPCLRLKPTWGASQRGIFQTGQNTYYYPLE